MSAWISSTTPTWILVARNKYYETRPDPDDTENLFEYRPRAVSVYESRGHTMTAAEAIVDATPTYAANGTVVCELRALPAEGADVIKTVDISLSAWAKGTTTIS